MKKNILFMHETFTDESGAVIRLNDLKEYLKNLSFSEKSKYLIEILKLSDINDKKHLKEITEYIDYLDKRDSSIKNKRKVVSVKKIKPNVKQYINDEINNFNSDIKNIISLSFDEFVIYIEKNDIDFNYLMLGIIKEINLYRSFADEAYINKDFDMILETKEVMLELQNKLNYLKNKVNNTTVIDEEKQNFNIIFLETSSLRSYFVEDIKGLDEFYPSFKKLFVNLQKGKPYDIRYFGSIDKNLDGLIESRDVYGKTRIFYKQLNDNTYIIIGAIVKKVDKSVGYKNQLENRYKYFLQHEQNIFKSLSDFEFLNRQQQYLEEVESKFSDDKSLIKKGG